MFASRSLVANLRRLRRDDRGAVAMMMGLGMIPLMIMAGAAIDYTRATKERTALTTALDATGLAMAPLVRTLSATQLQSRSQAYFDAVFHAQGGVGSPTIVVKTDTQRLSVSAESSVPTTLMQIAGVRTIPVSSAAVIAYGVQKIEVALVLDNTGSMRDANKMEELHKAASKFIDDLSAKARVAGEIKVSIVPFATQVRVDPSRAGEGWLSSAPWGWNGCIADRDQPWDVNAAPGAQHPAVKCAASTLQPIVGLSDVTRPGATTMLKDAIAAMTPGGATNFTVGLMWGMQTLTPGSPFPGADAIGSDTKKFIVALTDGTNTQNRWDGNGYQESPQVNDRTRAACANLKSAGSATVYTIRVIDGNADLLRSCASNPSNYFEAADASQIQPAFKSILDSILRIRVTS
jgi:Flp pilus assembly protein TadG